MRVVAIIQARMGSSRLPGKMLLPLAGQPLIWHLIHRLQLCSTVDDIVIATTTNAADTSLADFGEEAGIKVVRGSETDVLGRFGLAAEETSPDVIIRVNGDAPLIDPGFIDAQVAALIRQGADFVVLEESTPCIHDGVDAMSRRALDIMLTDAREDPVAIEHVTGYIKLNPDKFLIGLFEIPEILQWDGARLSIDTPADLAFMERLYQELGVPAGEARLADVSRLLQARPDLVALNAHVRQKEMTASHGTILIRTDGGGGLGFGHVMRTLAIGEILRDELGYGVIFAMNAQGRLADGVALVEQRGFRVERRDGASEDGASEDGASEDGASEDGASEDGVSESEWLLAICGAIKPASVLLDVRTELSADDVEQLRQHVARIITLDDGSDRRLAADVAIFPPVPQVQDMDWTGARGGIIADWDHVVLSSGASCHTRAPRVSKGPPKLFVNFGGSDPFGLTVPAAKLVSALADPVDATFVIGPGAANAGRTARDVGACSKTFRVKTAPDDFAAMAAAHDLALIAFGVTAYELAHLGVPMILVCLDEDQFASAAPFEDEGIASRFLMPAACQMPDIAEALVGWLGNAKKREKAAETAGRLIDGQGARRVAHTMLEPFGV